MDRLFTGCSTGIRQSSHGAESVGVVRGVRVSDEKMAQGWERGHSCPRRGGSPPVV